MPDKNERRKLPCIVCKTRKQRYATGTCQACQALVDAEKTHEKYGVPTVSPTQQRWQAMAAQYNELIKQRLTQQQIAPLMGMTYCQLRNQVNRWRSRGGIKVSRGWGSSIRIKEATLPPPTAAVKKRTPTEHGATKWGLKDCKCIPCRTKYLAARREHSVKYRLRRNKLRAEKKAQEKKEKPQGQ